MSVSDRLLQWFERHGRRDLPWQQNPTPYRVWISEIMLQQTQVVTVIPYYQRFMQRFSNLRSLAAASLDDVLHLWTGLGYYARARNLHRAATLICGQHRGRFPRDIEAVQQLPGIGRTTAGAILALSTGQRHAILDGNVKRVLTRFHGIAGWPGERAVEERLWALAEAHTPATDIAHYTQAMMDLGATICTRTRPACDVCPLTRDCAAHAQGRETGYPTPKPRKTLPVRETSLLILRNENSEVLLEQRPPVGIWGGLWSLPECASALTTEDVKRWCAEHTGYSIENIEYWPLIRHSFSHFHLDITPVCAQLTGLSATKAMEARPTVWYNIYHPDARGLAAPVKHLLTLCLTNRGDRMTRMVHCIKLGREAEGLQFPPYPGEMGKKIYENVSAEGWKMWLNHQTMLINENRLAMMDPKARKFLASEMEKFFFGAGSAAPEGYVPPSRG